MTTNNTSIATEAGLLMLAQHKTNHLLHLVLTVLFVGVWCLCGLE